MRGFGVVTAFSFASTGAVRRHLVPPLAAWVLVVALGAAGVAWVNANARTELEHRFRLRAVIASDVLNEGVDVPDARGRLVVVNRKNPRWNGRQG